MEPKTETPADVKVREYDDLLDNVVDATPRINMRAIYGDRDVAYVTYDGRKCVYSRKVLASVLGGAYASASPEEQSAFLGYCVSRRLDPVAKQVYCVRYQQGEPLSFVTSWEVFLDRAQRHQQYDGCENGIVWRVKDGEKWRVERGLPCDYGPDDEHTVAGGWARVHRKDQTVARYVEVPLVEMESRNREGRPVRAWYKMQTTMCLKVPTARALRQAFPEDLAGLYVEDEAETLSNAIRETERLRSGDVAPAKDLDELAARLDGSEESSDDDRDV